MNSVAAAIYSALNGDATLASLGVTGVYEDEATTATGAAAVPPYVIFWKAGGTETDRTHDGTAARRPAYYVKAVDKSVSTKRAGDIDNQIRELLNGRTFSTVDGKFLCFRTGDMPNMSEKVSGVTHKHAGGLYRFGPG